MPIVVKVEYKNRQMQTVSEKEYELQDYVDMIRVDMLKVITDVEDLVYLMNGNTPKENWGEPEWILFNKIKHRILDKAGDIQRLPSAMREIGADEKEEQTLGFWKSIFGDGVRKV